MRAHPWFLIVLVFLAQVLHGPVGRAQAVSPITTALPMPVNPAACTAAPRSTEELRQLMLEGIARRSEATPVAPGTLATPVVVRPADTATVAGVTATVEQFYACSNAGNLAAVVALATDDVARESLAGVATFTGHRMSGGQGTPSPDETPAPAILDALLAAFSVPVPLPSDQQVALLAVRDVAVLSNGWLQARVVTTSASQPEPVARMMYLAIDHGQYRYVGDGPLPSEQAATSNAGTPSA